MRYTVIFRNGNKEKSDTLPSNGGLYAYTDAAMYYCSRNGVWKEEDRAKYCFRLEQSAYSIRRVSDGAWFGGHVFHEAENPGEADRFCLQEDAWARAEWHSLLNDVEVVENHAWDVL